MGVKATLAIPLEVGGVLIGLLTMSSFRNHQAWPDDVIRSVHLIGEVFANAVARRREEAVRRQRAEETRELRDQLARVGRATLLGELAASIAHEVNQPLCAIVSNAEALRRMIASGACDDVEMREALDDITRDGRRASEVLARIRGFLRKTPPQRELLNVNELIPEVATLARADLTRRALVLTLALAEGLPSVLGDRVQLQQVVLNLLSNGAEASDHAGPGPRELVLSSFQDVSGAVGVAVHDAGTGIRPEDIDRIFDAFYTSKPGSLGMGLAICKSIINAHGGRIWATANPDRGTTVQFTLPSVVECAL
jgi:signal transduction histidine kinase